MARVRGRRRIRDGGAWIVLAGQFEDGLWTCSIFDEREEELAAAMHVRRAGAIEAALEDARARGKPDRILYEVDVCVERADLIARFHEEIRDYDRIAREQADPEYEEIAVFSAFLDAASLAVTALATGRDATFTLPLEGGAIATVTTGAVPAIIVASRDAADDDGGNDDPTTVGAVFVPQADIPQGMVRALRASGWRHGVFPTMRVTDANGATVAAGPRDMRRLTAAMDELIDAGLASIAYSQGSTG
jgi:hypothetical protein